MPISPFMLMSTSWSMHIHYLSSFDLSVLLVSFDKYGLCVQFLLKLMYEKRKMRSSREKAEYRLKPMVKIKKKFQVYALGKNVSKQA